jgi:hypothetical protein
MEIFELEEFDGERPMGTRLQLTGLAPQRTNDLKKGDEVILVVRAKIKKVSFSTDAKGVAVRVHSAAVEEAYPIPDGESHSAPDFLSDVRIAHKEAVDRHAASRPDGQQILDEPNDADLAALEAELEADENAVAAAEATADEPDLEDGVRAEGMTDEEWEASAENPNRVVAEPAAEEVTTPRKAAKLGKAKAAAR